MKEKKYFKVLEESVAKEDEFEDKTHEKVADTIYDVITKSSSKGLTIGLEGTWGSGKSTIVSILKRKILLNPDIYYFYFDAWSHEGDPLRRVFLESIVSQLANGNKELENLTNKISNRVKKTTVTTKQHATTLGKYLAVSSIFVPLGLALTNASTRNYDFVLGIDLSVYWPLVISLLVMLMPGLVLLANWLILFFKKYIQKKDLYICVSENWMFLQSESMQTLRQEIAEDDERSSIEFERYFDDIINIIFRSSTYHKLLIVIDNLDRVNPDETLKIWSTLQTFLQDRNPSGNSRPHYEKLWVLVPYDFEGLKKVWNRNGNNGAQSFFEKCFQLRIDVPSLILSGWESYCKSCIEIALSGWTPQQKVQILNVLRNTRDSVTDAPSPRQIKTYVNQIGLLAQNSDDQINIDAVSYYVILKYLKFKTKEELEEGLLSGTIPTLNHQEIFTESVVSEICGLLYGVSPEKGVQILIEPEIEGALSEGNNDMLPKIINSHPIAFWTVFDLHIQKISEQNQILKYTKTIWDKIYKEYESNLGHFKNKLIVFTKNLKTLDFPTEDSKANEIIALISILDGEMNSSLFIWQKISFSFQMQLKEMKVDIATLANNLTKITSAYLINKPNVQELNDIPIEAWLKWVGIDNNESRYMIKPSTSIIKNIVEKLDPKLPTDTELWSLLRFVQKQGIHTLENVEKAVINHIKVNGSSPNIAITNESLFKIVADLSFWGSKAYSELFNTFEIYNLSATLGFKKYVAIALGQLYQDKMSSLTISHSGSSNAGFQEAINFWNTSDQNNAQFVWNLASKFKKYIFIWNIAQDKSILLIKDLLKIGIAERSNDLFSVKDGLDSLNRCLFYFDKSSEEIKQICNLLIEFSDVETIVEETVDISESFSEMVVLLTHTPTKKIQLSVENKLISTKKEKWFDAISSDSTLIDVLYAIIKNNSSFKLSNEYANALVDFITNVITNKCILTSRQKDDLEILFTPLSKNFINNTARQIGRSIANINFEINSDIYGILKNHIDFSGIINTHSSNFEIALDTLSKNCSLNLVKILCKVIEDTKNKTYELPEQYPTVLAVPLKKLLESVNDENSNEIKYLAEFLKIDLSDGENINKDSHPKTAST